MSNLGMSTMKLLLAAILLALFALASNVAAQNIDIIDSSVNVTTSSTTILAAPAYQPRLIYVQNDSDTVIYCNLRGNAAVLNAGTRLNANGGFFFFDAPGTVPRTAITCIHGGTGNKLVLINVGQ